MKFYYRCCYNYNTVVHANVAVYFLTVSTDTNQSKQFLQYVLTAKTFIRIYAVVWLIYFHHKSKKTLWHPHYCHFVLKCTQLAAQAYTEMVCNQYNNHVNAHRNCQDTYDCGTPPMPKPTMPRRINIQT